MNIKTDSDYNKLITIPCVQADDEAWNYKYLHKKTLIDIDDLEDISEIKTYLIDNNPFGLVIEFSNPLRPNVIFRFSRQFDFDKFEKDENYMIRCQFFFWTDENNLDHIRFARPAFEIIEERSLIK